MYNTYSYKYIAMKYHSYLVIFEIFSISIHLFFPVLFKNLISFSVVVYPIISALRRLRQEDIHQKFKCSLGYIVRPYKKIRTNKVIQHLNSSSFFKNKVFLCNSDQLQTHYVVPTVPGLIILLFQSHQFWNYRFETPHLAEILF